LAVVARTQRWTTLRLARVSFLAAAGHVLTSIALGAIAALIGLQFQRQIETQQGHIVGAVLIVTGVGFLIWGLTGHGHVHEHGSRQYEPLPEPPNNSRVSADPSDGAIGRHQLDNQAHQHQHEAGVTSPASGAHRHEHTHAGLRHSHRHSHEAFVQARAELIELNTSRGTLAGHLAAIAVPFGVAASPDLTFLPFAIAASAYGPGSVAAVLGVFSVVTLAVFVGLTLIATAVGYQMRGEWLEENANTITSLVLIGIGVVAYIGF
jgi:putative Mn2+ efflux pump MntP